MNVYEAITSEIIKKLEEGVIPWQKPYVGVDLPPMNFKTKNYYHGINTLLLWMAGGRSPYWLTYKQAQELDGQVKKGAKGKRILFAKMVKYEDSDGKEKDKAIYRYSTVFNLSDIEGIECPHIEEKKEDSNNLKYIENCEKAIQQMKDENKIPEIVEHNNLIACYTPALDVIKTCPMQDYVSSEAYYATIFHEIIHSTGHSSRLNRKMNTGMQSKDYAKEELIAEIGACFLCSITGIKTKVIDNNAAYIKSWLKQLNDDPSLVVSASSKAQKAMDWLNIKIEIENVGNNR